MKICYKCNTEKEDKEFQTYWHSTQKKFRIRKECTKCLYKQKNERKRLKRKEAKLIDIYVPREIVQPVVQELQPDILEIPNGYRKCKNCNKVKLLNEYHTYSAHNKKHHFLTCKTCVNLKENLRTKRNRLKFLKDNGGSNYHLQKPNEYIDDYQRDATFNLMKRFGWTFNEENGIWWKEGIKTEEGVFINVTKRKRKKINPMAKIPKYLRTAKKQEMFTEVVKLRETGLSFHKIGEKLGISDTTVYKWLKDSNEKSN
jgi:hypothetical protein